MVGERSTEDGVAFLADLASRLAGRVQLTTDALSVYRQATPIAFGPDVDYAQLRKIYGIDAKD